MQIDSFCAGLIQGLGLVPDVLRLEEHRRRVARIHPGLQRSLRQLADHLRATLAALS